MKNVKTLQGFLALLAILLSGSLKAQTAFEKKNLLTSLGAIHYINGITPITLTVEYGLFDQVSFGLRGYYSSTLLTTYNASVFSNFHFSKVLNTQKIDPFAGISAEKSFFQSTQVAPSRSSSEIGINAQLGLRYLLIRKLGLYSQILVPLTTKQADFSTQKKTATGIEFGVSYKF